MLSSERSPSRMVSRRIMSAEASSSSFVRCASRCCAIALSRKFCRISVSRLADLASLRHFSIWPPDNSWRSVSALGPRPILASICFSRSLKFIRSLARSLCLFRRFWKELSSVAPASRYSFCCSSSQRWRSFSRSFIFRAACFNSLSNTAMLSFRSFSIWAFTRCRCQSR